MVFQDCIPPQQISPSAANDSPKSAATSQASRKVCAISLVLPTGSDSHVSGSTAESIRITPDGLTPNSLSFCAHLADFRTISTYFLRSSAEPRSEEHTSELQSR